MNRLRRWSVVCFTMLVIAELTPAEDPPATGEKWVADRALTLTPAAEPQPALKYRLLPLASELREGNAVPVYLRTNHGTTDETRRRVNETPAKWNDLPLDKVPLDEAHKFLDEVRVKFLNQIDYGARRKSADWGYTLEQPDLVSMLLPDLLTMRQYAPMLVLRARVAIADGDYPAAARAFETGFAFSRHVAEEGPFIIGGLVGLSIANMHVDRIPEWIERPGSPNLYWSLTALPRPLIGQRRQFDFELRVLELQFPDLATLDRSRTAGEWDAALKRVRAEINRIDELNKSVGFHADPATKPVDPDEPAARSSHLAAARTFLAQRLGKPAADVAKMPPAQVLLLYLAGTYGELRDEVFKPTYLPYADARPRFAGLIERLKTAPDSEGVRLARWFLPAISKVVTRCVNLDRKVAALRTIEALRLHAAANGGQLPDNLEQVTVVPVPTDPGTGKPFEYSRDGATATIVSRITADPSEATELRYRVTVRK
jgi:hypothetical protein